MPLAVGDIVTYYERGKPAKKCTVEAVVNNGKRGLLALRELNSGKPVSGFVAHREDVGQYHWRWWDV